MSSLKVLSNTVLSSNLQMNEKSPSCQRRHTSWRLWKADRICICWKEEEWRLIPMGDYFSDVGACLACCHQWSGWSLCSKQVWWSSGPCACPAEVSAACRWGHGARQCHKQLSDRQTRHRPFFTSKSSSMLWVSKTTWSTVDFPYRNPACSFGSKESTIGSTRL